MTVQWKSKQFHWICEQNMLISRGGGVGGGKVRANVYLCDFLPHTRSIVVWLLTLYVNYVPTYSTLLILPFISNMSACLPWRSGPIWFKYLQNMLDTITNIPKEPVLQLYKLIWMNTCFPVLKILQLLTFRAGYDNEKIKYWLRALILSMFA